MMMCRISTSNVSCGSGEIMSGATGGEFVVSTDLELGNVINRDDHLFVLYLDGATKEEDGEGRDEGGVS